MYFFADLAKFISLIALATQTRDSISYSPHGISLDISREFYLTSQKKKPYGARYPLVYYIQNNYSPHCR